MREMTRPARSADRERRPGVFVCPDCRGSVSLDLENLILPHADANGDCSASDVRVMVRWAEDAIRCPACGLAGLVSSEAQEIPPHRIDTRECTGSGQLGITRLLVVRGSISPKAAAPGAGQRAVRQLAAKIRPADARSGRSTSGRKVAKSSKAQQGGGASAKRKPASAPGQGIAGPVARAVQKKQRQAALQQATEARMEALRRAKVEAQRTEIAEARRRAWASSELADAYRQSLETRRKSERPKSAKTKRASKPSTPYVRIVSGGLPGTSRRH